MKKEVARGGGVRGEDNSGGSEGRERGGGEENEVVKRCER